MLQVIILQDYQHFIQKELHVEIIDNVEEIGAYRNTESHSIHHPPPWPSIHRPKSFTTVSLYG